MLRDKGYLEPIDSCTTLIFVLFFCVVILSSCVTWPREWLTEILK